MNDSYIRREKWKYSAQKSMVGGTKTSRMGKYKILENFDGEFTTQTWVCAAAHAPEFPVLGFYKNSQIKLN